MPLKNVYKLPLELPGQIWKLKNILFCQFEQLHLVWNFRKCLLPFNVFHFALIKFSNLNGCHDAKLPRKSENLAHILGYQNWAVTGQETDLERRIFFFANFRNYIWFGNSGSVCSLLMFSILL